MKGFFPIFAVPCAVSDGRTIFHTVGHTTTLEVPGALMEQLLELCDGVRPLTEIVSTLTSNWDESSLKNLIAAMRRKKLLVDSRLVTTTTWAWVENPSHTPSPLDSTAIAGLVELAQIRHQRQPHGTMFNVPEQSFTRLLGARRSVRSFTSDPVGQAGLITMLWSAYGPIATSPHTVRRTVPSAGALYPLQIHLVLMRDEGEVRRGIYRVYLGSSKAVGLVRIEDDVGSALRAFMDPLMIEGSAGVIVISGSLPVTAEKYGNRSALYVPLEAGHAAQNIHLAASVEGIGTVEIGGFVDQMLVEALRLPTGYQPLTSVVFGREGEEKEPELEVQWVVPMADQYRPPFVIALARVAEEINEDWSYGRDPSPALAQIKAISEAKEWAACGCVPKLIRSTFTDLSTAVDPQSILRFDPSQYRIKGFPFTRFSPTREYEWTVGTDEMTGTSVHVFADQVYFPYQPDTPPYVYANSSGVAAHPDRQRAVETGTLELVERDAFLNAYLSKLPPRLIRLGTLPQGIRNRIRQLERIGFQVWVIDQTLDLAPVACVFAQHEELAYTNCAACSSFDVEHAVSHALMEVEASVLARLQNGPASAVVPSKVSMPGDHGAVYEQREFFRRADFMFAGTAHTSFRYLGAAAAHSWQELQDRFVAKGWKLITVSLNLAEAYGGNGDLHIVRSIVPGMVPMTFGYRQEPGGMERIYRIARRYGSDVESYRSLTRFPHPFA